MGYCMVFYGIEWGIAWYSMVLHGCAYYSMVFFGIALGIAWYSMVLNGIAWSEMVHTQAGLSRLARYSGRRCLPN